MVVGGHDFDHLSGGANHTCAVTTAGDGYCWGWGSGGMLGTGTSESNGAPVPVTGDHVFTRISAGSNYSCGVTTSSAAYCWGSSVRGGPGHPPETSSRVPVRVVDPE